MAGLKWIWILLVCLHSIWVHPEVWAWGKRGHQLTGETAALLVSQETNSQFMKNRGFDMGFYNNVPDLVWKKSPEIYKVEKVEHFLDLEIFLKAFKSKSEIKKPFALTRLEFEAQFPEIEPAAGRALWRIVELNQKLTAITNQLKEASEIENKDRHKQLQEQWLVLAGVLGHYVADLSQPLHVTENYDGQLTKQKGIHAFFEDDMVDELYPELTGQVLSRAKKMWPKFTRANKEKQLAELVEQLVLDSFQAVPQLLKIDKATKRNKDAKTAALYKELIINRLVASSLTLAEIFRRQLGWKFLGDQFYFFDGRPEYIYPEHTN